MRDGAGLTATVYARWKEHPEWVLTNEPVPPFGGHFKMYRSLDTSDFVTEHNYLWLVPNSHFPFGVEVLPP